MKKILSLAIAAIAVLACSAASAQSYYLENSGRIYDRVETSASATNNGNANSVAKGAQSATAAGWVSSQGIAGGQQLGLGGAVETAGSGMAFNVSNGGGTGGASSQGWSDANVNGYNNFSNAHGTIGLAGFTDSGMAQPVGRGVDISVQAGRSQDGYAAGADGGSFSAGGYTQQLSIAGGATVAAAVSSTKESHASSEAGAVSFTDGTPAGQSAAYRHANAGNVGQVTGSFYDPTH